MDKLYSFLFILSVFFYPGKFSAQKSYKALLQEGNQKFNKKDYGAASGKFMEAAKISKNEFAPHYNLGNSLYKSQKFDEAEAEYKKAMALSKNKDDKMAALYNLGNVNMKRNQPEEAANLYKQALKLDPKNEKIRKNLEIAFQKQKQKKDEGKEKKDQDVKEKKGEEGNEKKGQNGEEEKEGVNKQSGGQGKQNEGKSQAEESAKNKDGKTGSKEEENIPKPLKDAILDRTSQREKETARRILNKNSYSMPESREKDW